MSMQNLFGAVLAFIFSGTAVQAHDWVRRDHTFLQFEFGEYRHPEPAWAAGGISCRGGWKIVRNRGFRHVSPLDCNGRKFVYVAHWQEEPLRVHVDSATGRIMGVSH